MSPESLSSLAAILLSLVFSYIPGLAPRYDALDPTLKRLIMLASLLLISLGAFALSCIHNLAPGSGNLAPGFSLGTECTQPGAFALAKTFLAALVANQSTYLITPKLATGEMRTAKS